MRKNEKYILSVFFVAVMIFLSMTAIGNEDSDIEFPRENGPYSVWISGKWYGSLAPSFIVAPVDGYYKLGPISIINYPNGHSGTLFINSDRGPGFLYVDGELQEIQQDLVYIKMKGFKGYYPGTFQYVFKLFYFGRIRIFGICEEIDLNP